MQRTPFDIPDQMRDAANRSINQAKKALDQFITATQKAATDAETSASSMREGGAFIQRQVMAYVEENIAASFDFAERLVKARTLEEIAAIQQEFVARQMQSAAAQGKGLGEMASRTAPGATKPKK